MKPFDIKYSAMRQSIIEDEFSALNDMQRQAVFNTEGPMLLLAGAGSGKTTVLINRIINLLKYGRGYEAQEAPSWATEADLKRLAAYLAEPEETVPEEIAELCAVDPPKPYEIIAITFTNKAAKELKDRLEAACGEIAGQIWAHTFHSACIRILRQKGEAIGYGKNFTIYDEDDKKKVMAEALKELGFDEKKFDLRSVGGEISRAKDHLMTPADYLTAAGEDYYKKTVGRIYENYQNRLRSANALDFDDIIMKTVDLLRSNEDARLYYQRKFRYVLVDEYQDTNYAQYMLCSLLAGGYGNICVVGDDDQSIYKFRGATIENILQFEKQYDHARTIRLEQNYRSTSNILSAANEVIANNTERKGKKLWTENGDGDKVHFFTGENQEEEGQYISSEILKAYAQGQKFSDFAVLYRNHALSNSVETAFKRNAIPYRMVSGLRFFDRAEVKDMLAYLWVINNPSDTIRLRRIINNPPRKIGAKTLDHVTALAMEQNCPEYEIIRQAASYEGLGRAAEALSGFSQMIEELREKSQVLPLDELYDLLLEKNGYLEMLKNQNNNEARSREENILELKSNIVDFMKNHEEGAGLEEFLEEIALFTDIDRYDTQADAVTMMTMHSAKGLEFPVVFLCGFEEGIFPSYRSVDTPEELEEERRICYVAMTRAKRCLHISCAKRRMLYGQTAFAKPSRFVEEIPEEYLQTHKTERPMRQNSPRIKPSVAKTILKSSITLASSGGEKKEMISLRPGEKISHKAFGSGVVEAATPMGSDVLLEVKFDQVGTKMMMLKTASAFITKK
ncbi:ATP-dependent helicase [Acidaminobacterium chupaoyuni]